MMQCESHCISVSTKSGLAWRDRCQRPLTGLGRTHPDEHRNAHGLPGAFQPQTPGITRDANEKKSTAEDAQKLLGKLLLSVLLVLDHQHASRHQVGVMFVTYDLFPHGADVTMVSNHGREQGAPVLLADMGQHSR